MPQSLPPPKIPGFSHVDMRFESPYNSQSGPINGCVIQLTLFILFLSFRFSENNSLIIGKLTPRVLVLSFFGIQNLIISHNISAYISGLDWCLKVAAAAASRSPEIELVDTTILHISRSS